MPLKISSQKLRIISGKWRSRKFSFPLLTGLRPTSDRVRETLFNWLAPYITQSHCLDLFAGSGILGIEALSRGASFVEFCDSSSLVIQHIQTLLETFANANVNITQASIPEYLRKKITQPFDIVFLDPPFHQHLIESTCHSLEDYGWLAKKSWIYIEMEITSDLPDLPDNWTLIKQGKAGQVKFFLIQRLQSSD